MSSESGASTRIEIFDTTLRDGEQSPRVSWNTEEKLQIARALERLHVDVIEAGFPISSPEDLSAVRAISREIRGGPAICALARAASEDIKVAAEAVRDAARPRIHTFISTSDIHITHQLQSSRDDVRGLTRASVAQARELCDDVEFSPMDATRADREFTAEICQIAVSEGARVINIPDTVGYATPEEYGELISFLARELGVDRESGLTLSTHCHNDLGLAVANSWSGIRAGARQVESAINGIGERAGNCSTEELIMLLRTRGGSGWHTTADATQIAESSRLVSRLSGYPVQPNKAIVGRNAFAHESGIHQDGVLKERATYEIIDPADVGLISNELVLGKHSGRHALAEALRELGHELTGAELNAIFKELKLLTAKKKEITSQDLLALLEQRQGESGEPLLSWEWFESESGSTRSPRAKVLLRSEKGGCYGSGRGDGPVEAVFEAILSAARDAGLIDRGVSSRLSFSELQISSVTEGGDALGDASVIVSLDGVSKSGHAVSPDVVEAAARAYLMALNKLLGRGG